MKKSADPVSLLRLKAVCARTGLSRAALYQLQRQGKFPQSFRLAGQRAVAWRSDEIQTWIEVQPRSKEQPVRQVPKGHAA